MTARAKTALGDPLTLPCGAVLRNRFVKAAMSDELGDGTGGPGDTQARLYERWAEGGLAVSIVGETQIGPDHPESCGNLLLNPVPNRTGLRALTARATRDGAHLWAQLGHAGALAVPIAGPARGPSAVAVEGLTAEAMPAEEVAGLPARFAEAAVNAIDAGFTGVEIHAGHGFLLSQFLSPLLNRRDDDWGGDADRRRRLLVAVIAAVRAALGPTVPICLKINATDQLEGGVAEADFLATVERLADSPLDLIDISGGAYFPGAKAASDAGGKGAYFLDAARKARALTATPLMTVGGFKTRDQVVAALADGAVDAIGLARALVLDPSLPGKWIAGSGADPSFPRFAETPPGGVTAWYTTRIAAIAEDRDAGFDIALSDAIKRVEARRAANAERWREATTNKFQRVGKDEW